MKLSRRKIAAENRMLTERLEECQVLLSALALARDGVVAAPEAQPASDIVSMRVTEDEAVSVE